MRFLAYSAMALCATGAHAQSLEFAEVTGERGLNYSGNCGPGCSIAVGDYDSDGWEDVALIGRGNGALVLFRNQHGTFVDVSAVVLPENRPRSSGALFTDLDGDGDQDLVLARWHAARNSTSFYALDNQDGVFVRPPHLESLGEQHGKLAGLTAGDLDHDGLPEIVLMRPSNGTIIRNHGNFVFSDDTAAAGMSFDRTGLPGNWSAVLAHFANTERLDLHVAIDYDVDVHAESLPDGSFADRSEAAGTGHVGNDMGVAVSDVDNDGDLDIFSTNIYAHTLYINDGAGVFNNEAAQRGAADEIIDWSRWGYGCTFADLDLDGDEDLITLAAPGTGKIMLNDGAGYFTPATFSGIDLHGYALVAFDYDRDGDLDLMTSHSSIPPRLFERVGTPDNQWLSVSLRARISPTDGLGARVIAEAGGAQMMREVFTGDSFYSARSQRMHFGLGDATLVDRLHVSWPSGVTQTFSDIASNQTRVIVEPELRDGRPIADLDSDCDVDLDDLLLVLLHFGRVDASPADVDLDQDTDLSDLSGVLVQFGTACTE